ncbi:GntR family transcriptional regulator [Streptacidiphilus jiangxiensis]|uniref:Winged helix-turn helix n=1 Tax=Streptacidiphilus jiangxiensis TaxID=235985 RepID=A0A1H7R0Z2_STRJI|nr:GntR family transcriptional regulator [Streptacidiphilus jiangxiensis]SEL53759.1 Winged helix-turn helix [Streptacidiphilus jiangxiensis]
MPASKRSTSDRHKYARIADQIGEAIGRGEFPPGHNIPSERDLAERFGANRQTIRAAVLRLRAEGRLASDSLGTHVLPPPAGTGEEQDEFPGLLVPARGPVRARGRLSELQGRAREVELPAEHESVVFEHDVESPEAVRLQRSVSTFHPLLVDRTPALAGALVRLRTRADGASGPATELDLRDLHRGLRTAFPALRRTDRVHVQAADPAATGSVRVERVLQSPGGPVLLRTVFHLDGSTVLLPSAPLAPGAPGGEQEPLVLTPAERAWLEAWTLPGATSRALAIRARIVLACDRSTIRDAAEALRLNPDLVRAWLARFRAGGPQALRQRVKSARGPGDGHGDEQRPRPGPGATRRAALPLGAPAA